MSVQCSDAYEKVFLLVRIGLYVCNKGFKQGIKFIIFCPNQGIDLSIFVLNKISLLGR